MPPKTQTGKGIKGKSFNDVCNNFADACSEIDFETDDLASDLLPTLQATTENSQGLNESDMTAVKVVQLLLPVVNVLINRMVIKNYATQDAKIEKIYSAARLNNNNNNILFNKISTFLYNIHNTYRPILRQIKCICIFEC